MKNNKKIALLIPAYNEEKYIQGVIESCTSYGMDIIIVDDGSIDSTAEKVRSLISLSGNALKLIIHPENMGKGRALITGFEYIMNNDYAGVITLDADGQHDAGEIESFLKIVRDGNPDLVIGDRLGNTRGMPFMRLATNVFTSWIISRIAGKRVSDVQSGYRYLKSSALRKIKLKTSNFDTEPEIIMRAGWHNMKILNVPIKTIYHDDFTSYVNPVTDTVKFFKLVFNSLKWKREFKRAIS
ncbi:MAG: glycosyltransferase family 2 protein [Actinomycetia bacterium]|nr:glycosyltransferase family 2 protein [Actinomycetes bacterium]